ncbi:MAG: hypothetical protein JSV14_04925 [Deltaproteobacteria bacterium]|nr:MAG: hypothetical protein JSV14_04925 [Deltaproteobacteria bacterium]
MKTRLQHFFHPLNLWCRVGGKFTFAFRLYETYCWQPVLRRWLGASNGKEIYFSSGDKEADKRV